MGIEAWITIAVILMAFGLLAGTRLNPDAILMGGLAILLISGVLKPKQALIGFSNEGMITIAVLFVVVAGLRETGSIGWIIDRILGKAQTASVAQRRIMFPVAAMSGFLNSTPLVATLMPGIVDWAKKYQVPASKLLIPLSYAAILGGTCTLIGTSTNLLVDGLLEQANLPRLSFFEIAWVGVPCTIAGILFVLISQRWLLPGRRPAVSPQDDPREYTLEMVVAPGSSLVGKTIEQAGLRHLRGTYLMEIDREGEVFPAVGSHVILHANDRLVFVGDIDSILDLQKMRGLSPATEQIFKLDAPRSERCLIEAVVSDTCPLVGRSIRNGRFRTRYNAAVVAVARNGERLRMKIGDVVLRPGDTLLLEARPSFADRQRNSRDFYLVSRLEDSTPVLHEKAWISMAIMAGLVACVTLRWMSMLNAGMIAAGLMLLTGCCRYETAHRNINWPLLISIAAAIGIGEAMRIHGVADLVGKSLTRLGGSDPFFTLVAVYAVTVLFTEIITNNAAAILVFPIAHAAAMGLGVSFMPFVIAVMIGASASFATPIGYQTNLMVYGPGGYHFTDFARIGLPLSLLIAIVALTIIPNVWSF